MQSSELARLIPELEFVASVGLRLDDVNVVGKTPDGIRMQFMVHGTVDGPRLKGEFPKGTVAYLRIDEDGVGTIHVRAALTLIDGAKAELEATGRYDFGPDGFDRAAKGDLPDSDLGWCPRLVTDDQRYLWLNRTQFLGIGKLVPREKRVDYDLFALGISAQPAHGRPAAGAPAGQSLYERLGGKPGIYRLMSASIDSLHNNAELNGQNPKLAAASLTTDPARLKEKVTEFICKLTGGPCVYTGRTMQASHAHLDITEADWRVFIDDTVRVLTTLDVPPAEQRELLELMATTKSDIVKPA